MDQELNQLLSKSEDWGRLRLEPQNVMLVEDGGLCVI